MNNKSRRVRSLSTFKLKNINLSYIFIKKFYLFFVSFFFCFNETEWEKLTTLRILHRHPTLDSHSKPPSLQIN